MNRHDLLPFLRGGLLGGLWLLRLLCAPPFVARLLLHAHTQRWDRAWLRRFRRPSAPADLSLTRAPYRLYPLTCSLLE